MKVILPLSIFIKEILQLVRSPMFIFLTFFGNGLIGICSLIFYSLEYGINPKVRSHLDAVWWSFATATTTGYGDIVPQTNSGKILGILLMVGGTALFAMYTALFADTILLSKKRHM
jgi:voltage-gated potassium channel